MPVSLVGLCPFVCYRNARELITTQEKEDAMPRREAGVLELPPSQATLFLSARRETCAKRPISTLDASIVWSRIDAQQEERLAHLEEKLDLLLSGSLYILRLRDTS